jgi:hypothetical protein
MQTYIVETRVTGKTLKTHNSKKQKPVDDPQQLYAALKKN